MNFTREVNLDTQSSDISAEVIRESGRPFQPDSPVPDNIAPYPEDEDEPLKLHKLEYRPVPSSKYTHPWRQDP